ncbi:MAG: hypothetical protein LBC20_08950 [Planctomycetaceae bacterium]|nr:hypothetical protein [Planctomycetaceae bacterium]
MNRFSLFGSDSADGVEKFFEKILSFRSIAVILKNPAPNTSYLDLKH